MSSKDYIYCYQGSALRVGSGNVVVGKLFDPYDPSTLEPFTFRCRFNTSGTPTTTQYGVSWSVKQIDSEGYVWDITNVRSSRGNFAHFLAGQNGLVEILCASTTGATNMLGLIRESSSITTVPLFDTSSATILSGMFYYCTSLTSVPLFDTSSATTMEQMFTNCGSLRQIPLFDTSSCTKMGYMFRNCRKVESGALALYQQASTQSTTVTDHYLTFQYCGADTVTGAAEVAQIPSDWK